MKKYWIVLLFYVCAFAQQEEHAWVYFKDKPNAVTDLNQPLNFLTQRALDRRTNQNISLDITDAPIEPSYVNQVQGSSGISLLAKSKWLNVAYVSGLVTDIQALTNFSFVEKIVFANKSLNNGNPPPIQVKKDKVLKPKSKFETLNYTYGNSYSQVSMLGVHGLHSLGFEGGSKHVAVMDAGFVGVNTAGAFSHLTDSDVTNGEILGGYNYVHQNNNFYVNTGSNHGTMVLSCMAGLKTNSFVGTAPKSKYYLYVTEDVNQESPLEECLWVAAAEQADSLGVDIINSSLGYTEFDNSSYNYTYNDMDGNTAFITLGATMAATKGILVVNSAGNSGNDTWHYIGAPADALNILAVGAVSSIEQIGSFSSFGPSSDLRVKPEVLAHGVNTYVVNENNMIAQASGTSFASPIMAGAIACLWDAYPSKTNLEIRDMVIQSSDLYQSPQAQRGYGVPDFLVYANQLGYKNISKDQILSFSSVIESDVWEIQLLKTIGGGKIQLVDVNGKVVFSQGIQEKMSIDTQNFTKGIYFLRIQADLQQQHYKIIKI